MSARAAGIPKPTHSSPPVPELIPLSKALPMMGLALWCVWAAYTTTELPEMAVLTPGLPEVATVAAEPSDVAALPLDPGMVGMPSNTLSAFHVMVEGIVAELCACIVKENIHELSLFPDGTAVEPPEVAASTAESPEVSVVSTYKLLSCSVPAREAVWDASA